VDEPDAPGAVARVEERLLVGPFHPTYPADILARSVVGVVAVIVAVIVIVIAISWAIAGDDGGVPVFVGHARRSWLAS